MKKHQLNEINEMFQFLHITQTLDDKHNVIILYKIPKKISLYIFSTKKDLLTFEGYNYNEFNGWSCFSISNITRTSLMLNNCIQKIKNDHSMMVCQGIFYINDVLFSKFNEHLPISGRSKQQIISAFSSINISIDLSDKEPDEELEVYSRCSIS